jgi:mRNA export factor
VELPERAYAMDTKDSLLVVGTADRHVAIFNLTNPTAIYKSLQSPLKYQTRVVSCFATGNGFAVGSVEGRCAIQYVDDKVTDRSLPC